MTISPKFEHQTVLLYELVDALNLQPGSLAIDCTAGGGGHTRLLLEKVGLHGKVIAFDRDPEAIRALTSRFSDELANGQLVLVNEAFSGISRLTFDRPLMAICADLGVSSPQLDFPERGFSFMRDGPLDMRMDPTRGMSAADIVNQFNESELADLIYQYGEEPKSRIIARKIIERRRIEPFSRTLQLANFISDNIHYREKSRTHKATRTFQALRIAVNQELVELEHLLEDGFNLLAPGGMFAIISFHSLEDRIIKHKFRAFCGKLPNLRHHEFRHLPIDAPPIRGKILKPFPLIPSNEEIKNNPRARSAKLRCLQKL